MQPVFTTTAYGQVQQAPAPGTRYVILPQQRTPQSTTYMIAPSTPSPPNTATYVVAAAPPAPAQALSQPTYILPPQQQPQPNYITLTQPPHQSYIVQQPQAQSSGATYLITKNPQTPATYAVVIKDKKKPRKSERRSSSPRQSYHTSERTRDKSHRSYHSKHRKHRSVDDEDFMWNIAITVLVVSIIIIIAILVVIYRTFIASRISRLTSSDEPPKIRTTTTADPVDDDPQGERSIDLIDLWFT